VTARDDFVNKQPTINTRNITEVKSGQLSVKQKATQLHQTERTTITHPSGGLVISSPSAASGPGGQFTGNTTRGQASRISLTNRKPSAILSKSLVGNK